MPSYNISIIFVQIAAGISNYNLLAVCLSSILICFGLVPDISVLNFLPEAISGELVYAGYL